MFRHKSLDRTKWRVGHLLILAGIVIIGAVIFGIVRSGSGIKGDTYQLIKLESGESDIGKLSGVTDAYATLGSPYIYKEPAGGQAANADTNEIQLLRVSSVDGDLRIATNKIVYWGNLPKEGRVVNAIKSAGK